MFELNVSGIRVFAISLAIFGLGAVSASAETVRAVEYFHKDFEHYFVTANPQEIALLDGGVFKGWWRTGQRYRVDDSPAPDLVPVCRFFTAEYAGKASHFYTASAAECEHVKTMPDWTYEGVAFHVRLPDASGICGARYRGNQPVVQQRSRRRTQPRLHVGPGKARSAGQVRLGFRGGGVLYAVG